jgi:hypothetical protein
MDDSEGSEVKTVSIIASDEESEIMSIAPDVEEYDISEINELIESTCWGCRGQNPNYITHMII